MNPQSTKSSKFNESMQTNVARVAARLQPNALDQLAMQTSGILDENFIINNQHLFQTGAYGQFQTDVDMLISQLTMNQPPS